MEENIIGFGVKLSTKRYVKVWKTKKDWRIRFADHRGKVRMLRLTKEAMYALVKMVLKIENVI